MTLQLSSCRKRKESTRKKSLAANFTGRIRIESVNLSVVSDPSFHLYEVGHETRYQTFKNPSVTPEYELVNHSALVELLHNCSSAKEKRRQ